MDAPDLTFREDAVTYLVYAEVAVSELEDSDDGAFVDRYCVDTYLVSPLYLTFVQLPLVP